MFPFNLDHQAGVMYAIHTFVDVCLNLDLSDEDFIFDLERLYCAFEAFKQEGIEYAASIRAFIAVTEYVNSQRGMLSFGEYLSGRSVGGIKALRRILHAHRGFILEEIEKYRNQEEDNQKSFLAEMNNVIVDRSSVLIVRVDLSYAVESLSAVTIDVFDLHIQSLRRALKDKNGCFKHLLTFGLVLEHGATKGFHAHLMLVYNSSKIQNDVYYGFEVIDKWKEITMTNDGCIGIGFNVNLNKKKYKKKGTLGIGEISRNSAVQHANALRVAEYLVRPEKYSQMMLIKLGVKNTFTKGKYKPHGRNYQTHYKQKQLGCSAINLAAED
ncbi:inovirus-type Gp2 protein [Acinetobacter sp. YH12219]|uniref:inovirus-type Gp2 protein n=1 Tax=Acinetobacter sp. YH12219 TaxID=2601153 RepID=UPI0015D2FB04